jgi:hybrid cluster-associated redox disulfide protein
MRNDAIPTAEMTVDEVMRQWPSTIRVFLDFRMRCVGCPIGAFHSVDETCEEHDVDADGVPVEDPGDSEGGGLGSALAGLDGFLAFGEGM